MLLFPHENLEIILKCLFYHFIKSWNTYLVWFQKWKKKSYFWFLSHLKKKKQTGFRSYIQDFEEKSSQIRMKKYVKYWLVGIA